MFDDSHINFIITLHNLINPSYQVVPNNQPWPVQRCLQLYFSFIYGSIRHRESLKAETLQFKLNKHSCCFPELYRQESTNLNFLFFSSSSSFRWRRLSMRWTRTCWRSTSPWRWWLRVCWTSTRSYSVCPLTRWTERPSGILTSLCTVWRTAALDRWSASSTWTSTPGEMTRGFG